jgi:hypothetical protein
MNSKRRIQFGRLGLAAIIVGGAALELASGTPAASAAQGSGNPVLIVSPNKVSPSGSNTVTITGRDYLVPPHAPGANVFGGVYVFYGWVRPGGKWGPSIRNSNNNDGMFGVTYSYSGDGGDASTRDDGSGIVRLVSFTVGGTSGSSTPYHMDDNGNWTTTLKIPGPTYQWSDPISGAAHAVDCRTVQCGIYTIGAHGKASATNEKFAPITFATPSTPTTTKPHTNPPATTGNHQSGGTGTTPAPTSPTIPGSNPGNVTATTVRNANAGPSTTAHAGATSTTAPRKAKAKAKAVAKKKKSSTTDETTSPTTTGKRASTALEPISAHSSDPAPVGLIVFGVVALLGVAVGTPLLIRRRRQGAPG